MIFGWITHWAYSGKQTRGGKGYYSDIVIDSLLALNGLSLGVPDYTTVCRGRKTLDMSKKAQKVAPKGKHSFFNRCKRIKMLWGKRMDAIQT